MIFLSTSTHYHCHEQKGSDTQPTGRNSVERYLSQCSSFWLRTMRCNCSLNGDCRTGVLRLSSAEAKCAVQLRLLVHIRKPIGSKTKTYKNNIRSSFSFASKECATRKGKSDEGNKRVGAPKCSGNKNILKFSTSGHLATRMKLAFQDTITFRDCGEMYEYPINEYCINRRTCREW
jgi:hypothetical protein